MAATHPHRENTEKFDPYTQILPIPKYRLRQDLVHVLGFTKLGIDWYQVTIVIRQPYKWPAPSKYNVSIFRCDADQPPNQFVFTYEAIEYWFAKQAKRPTQHRSNVGFVSHPRPRPLYVFILHQTPPLLAWKIQIPRARDILKYHFPDFHFLGKQAPPDQYKSLLNAFTKDLYPSVDTSLVSTPSEDNLPARSKSAPPTCIARRAKPSWYPRRQDTASAAQQLR